MSVVPDLAGLAQVLTAISSLAVIVGVVFIVVQLRQNNRLIDASNRQAEANLLQAKSGVALNIVERFTDDAFTRRRKAVRDIVKQYNASNWEGFLETNEDFEVRAFFSYYEFTAYLARKKIIDLETLAETLQYRAVFDWEVVAPVVSFYRKTWGLRYIAVNFEWLARETRDYMKRKEQEMAVLQDSAVQEMPPNPK